MKGQASPGAQQASQAPQLRHGVAASRKTAALCRVKAGVEGRSDPAQISCTCGARSTAQGPAVCCGLGNGLLRLIQVAAELTDPYSPVKTSVQSKLTDCP